MVGLVATGQLHLHCEASHCPFHLCLIAVLRDPSKLSDPGCIRSMHCYYESKVSVFTRRPGSQVMKVDVNGKSLASGRCHARCHKTYSGMYKPMSLEAYCAKDVVSAMKSLLEPGS